jgi:hypothetical protein
MSGEPLLRGLGMGGHHSPAAETEVWLTPPHIINALGSFDLDPCACMEPRPWPTAASHYTKAENGLLLPWLGRVWCNPPYGGPAVIRPWLQRMAAHGRGTLLIFARTETDAFHEFVWGKADALLFLRGRLHFHYPDGTRAKANAGAPNVLAAYGEDDARRLAASELPGMFVMLRL